MSLVVFCGPSVTPEDARAVLPDATFLAPAQCGDIYRASLTRPLAIALCDGYFDQRLSVWHKEILWALARGIAVYGAASMGALRAAELAPFGMIGVGRIFEQYRDGLIEDDDEVAVLHETQDRGYRPRSEALVNIRATLERAAAEQVLGAPAAAACLALAQRMFYAERSYPALLARAEAERPPIAGLDALRRWLLTHPPINQKRLDAFALLERIRDDFELHPPDSAAPGSRRATPLPSSRRAAFHFEYTDAWHTLKRKLDAELRSEMPDPSEARPSLGSGASVPLRSDPFPSALPKASPTPSLAPLDDPPSDPKVWHEALERALALALAKGDHVAPGEVDVQRRSEEFRTARNLFTPEQTSQWLSHNDLDLRGFSVLIYDEVLISRYRARARQLAAAQVPSSLRVLGQFRST